MPTAPDARTALWLEYAWAVVTGNAATAALVAEAEATLRGEAGAPADEVEALFDELADEVAGRLPATAGWFGDGWAPGGVVCLEEVDDAFAALAPETWAALADATTDWRHAGRDHAADDAWWDATGRCYRQALADGTWQPGWFGRFWDLAGVDAEASVVAAVGSGPEGLADAVALAVALRPNLVLTTSERLADGLHHHAPDLVAVAIDPDDGTRAEGTRHLGFNQWALAAATLLR